MQSMQDTATASSELLEAWTTAFNRADLKSICALYAPDALLWGTSAQTVVSDLAGIEAYFLAVFAIRPTPSVQVTECIAREYGDVALLAGSYDLILGSGVQPHIQPARFTFTLRQSRAGWFIAQHHSSKMPTEPLVSQAGAAGGA